MIYCGPLGQQSSQVIEYFEVRLPLQLIQCSYEYVFYSIIASYINYMVSIFKKKAISGVAKIRDNYNPAAWMLEVTSTSSEAELGVDFAEIYKNSSLHE